ncbi:thioredoxin domain-containing protein [Fimicolochytrium jonesii]|uniref:thioredoxin domain-containing protein n=1 Tax=Fimicolochytrium jonesii TaxID=1396493 RepID=UPI0022FEA304|nr:thioredoxin domain-containing protein [Fimicolochytrium jonesii]KAI8816759.1 thioredoxin domain-containing protein [Fimicolochytrium jonesii]
MASSPADGVKVTIFYSSVAGSLQVKKNQIRVENILAARKIEYKLVDVAAEEEERDFMQRKSGKISLPQIFVDGEYRGGPEELEEANEDGEAEVRLFLGL